MAQHIIDISIRARVVSCGAAQHYNRLRHTDVDADAGVAGGSVCFGLGAAPCTVHIQIQIENTRAMFA